MVANPSILSGAWVNERVENVLTITNRLLDRILFEGLLSSGYAPLEKPLDEDLLRKMTAEEVSNLLTSITDPGARLAILKELNIDVPDEIS